MSADPLIAMMPAARARWKVSDPVIHRLSSRIVPSRTVPPRASAFEALLSALVYQQVSVAAGNAIHRRLMDCLGDASPERVLAVGIDGLRGAGLSGRKAVYATDLAEHVADGRLVLDALPSMSDESVVDAITRVKGFGTWSAKMFLIFHLHRPDVVAPEDLGLRVAVAEAYGVDRDEAGPHMETLRAGWHPYSSVAALVLWASRHQ